METGEKEWLKISETAELVGLPGTRAYELVQQGELSALRIDVRGISACTKGSSRNSTGGARKGGLTSVQAQASRGRGRGSRAIGQMCRNQAGRP
jgi:hypothetical protein